MTDSSTPPAPKPPRRKPAREPATIDLSATVVDDGSAREDLTRDDLAAATPEAGEAERVREAVAIEMAAPIEPAGDFAPPPTSEGPAEYSVVSSQSPAGAGFGTLLGAALIGGLIGAGLMVAWDSWRGTPENQRLAVIEQKLSVLPPPNGGALQGLNTRLQALEAAKAATEERLAAAQKAAEEALNRPAASGPSPQEEAALAALQQRLQGLEGSIQATTKDAASARQAIENQVVDLTKRVAQAPDDVGKATLRLVLAHRIGDSLRNGQPYADTLQILRAQDTDAARLTALEPMAPQGAPTAAALAQSFQPLAVAILRDNRPDAGTLTDRFLRLADRIVTIRPVNEPESTDIRSLVARIEQALGRGNVQEAVTAWEALPEPSRRLSADWGARAKARASADAAVKGIADDSLATLNKAAR